MNVRDLKKKYKEKKVLTEKPQEFYFRKYIFKVHGFELHVKHKDLNVAVMSVNSFRLTVKKHLSIFLR